LRGRFIELLLAGGIAEVLYLGKFRFWGNQDPLEPAPSELNFTEAFFATTVPLMLGMFFTLMIMTGWLPAGSLKICY
jgi:hypothetical protein